MANSKICGEWSYHKDPDRPGKRIIGPCGKPATKEYNLMSDHQPQIRALWKPVCDSCARVAVRHFRWDIRDIKA